MKKNKIIILSCAILVILSSITIITPMLIAHKMQDTAVKNLNERYNEDFTTTDSTASDAIFSKEYTITLKSNKTDTNYQFDVNDDQYTGNYYGENVNVEINALLTPYVDGLVMANAHVAPTEAVSYKEAGIEELTVKVLTDHIVDQAQVDEMANVLKQELGDVPVTIETLYINEQSIYDGLIEEIKLYFQYSDVSVDRFENFEVEVKQYTY